MTPWTAAYQALLSIGFSRQEYWSGLPFPSARDLPDPGIQPASLEFPALADMWFGASAVDEWPQKTSEVQSGFNNPKDIGGI